MNITNIGKLSFFYSDKSHGNMSSEVGDTSDCIANRQSIIEQLPKNKRNVYIKSLHTNKIINAETAEPEGMTAPSLETYSCDAIYFDASSTTAWLLPADCMPAVFYTPDSTNCMMLHISRKTIDMNLINDSLDKFLKWSGEDIENVLVFCGPHIRKQSYVFARHIADDLFDDRWSKFISAQKSGTVSVDLLSRTKYEFKKIGINPNNIQIDPNDTGNGNYFSNSASRRDPSIAGRNAAIVFAKNYPQINRGLQ